MIIKHVPMRSVKKSDFAGLAEYITDKQGKTERVGLCTTTNCDADTITTVIGEVLATQRLNTRATGDKTYHLLVSFRPGENPDAAVLKAIEERICSGLGYGEHQRVSVVHHDTDNFHIHIAINKIHPTRLTMQEPYRAYQTLAELCSVLERDYGLESDNHQSRRTTAEGRAADMERHSGIESLLSWIRRECLEKIRGAQSWPELHQVLRENGLELRERANGLIIEACDGTIVKASTVARDISKAKLEDRLGLFEESVEQTGRKTREYQKRPVRMRINTVELYAKYKSEILNLSAAGSRDFEKIRYQKNRKIEAAKRANRLLRLTIKLMKGRPVKKLLYAQAHKKLQRGIESINNHYQKERQALKDQYQRRTWADWLKKKALDGDAEALAALRSREAAQGLKGNTIRGEGQPGLDSDHTTVVDNITKKGTIILHAGKIAVRDDGNKLKVSRKITRESLRKALQLAIARYGNRITVNGTAGFKESIVQEAAASKLPLTFADPSLENRRQQLLIKECKNDQQHNRGQTNLRGPGYFGSRTAANPNVSRAESKKSVTLIAKPDIGSIGRNPPPQSRNRLRTLSQLGMVRITSGTEVLLSGDVLGHLEQSGTQPDNTLRRRVFEPGINQEGITSADKYIAEREQKKLSGLDIPKHCRYFDSEGPLTYAGTRNIDGQMLTLLKRDNTIMVLSIDLPTARRLKRLAVGDAVTVIKGKIKTKGRSR
ncbi:MAG: TraI/MobA(P) family conjugative relaxase [Pseudomonadota bacterium]